MAYAREWLLGEEIPAELGVEVVGEAVDGPDAISVYGTLDPPAVPDVVILDNRMPNLTGLEAADPSRLALPRPASGTSGLRSSRF